MRVILNVVAAKMDVTRAVGAGREHPLFLPDVVLIDRFGLEPSTKEGWGSARAVRVDPEIGLRSAAADPRTEGTGVGQAECAISAIIVMARSGRSRRANGRT